MFEGEESPSDEVGSQNASNYVGFVKREYRRASVGFVKMEQRRWSSESSDDYMVMVRRRKKETQLRISGPKLKIYIN